MFKPEVGQRVRVNINQAPPSYKRYIYGTTIISGRVESVHGYGPDAVCFVRLDRPAVTYPTLVTEEKSVHHVIVFVHAVEPLS